MNHSETSFDFRGYSVPVASTEPETAGGIGVLEKPDVKPDRAPGDNERYAHYVRRDKVMASAVTGQPVVALCGKVWVPMRNPAGFPICPVCKKIREEMNNMGPGWPFSGGSNPS